MYEEDRIAQSWADGVMVVFHRVKDANGVAMESDLKRGYNAYRHPRRERYEEAIGRLERLGQLKVEDYVPPTGRPGRIVWEP